MGGIAENPAAETAGSREATDRTAKQAGNIKPDQTGNGKGRK